MLVINKSLQNSSSCFYCLVLLQVVFQQFLNSGASPVHAGSRPWEQEGGNAAQRGGGAEGSCEEGGVEAEEQGEGSPARADEQLRGRGRQREHFQRQRHQKQN